MDREGEGTEIDREEAQAPLFTFELRLFGTAEARLNGTPLPRLRAKTGLTSMDCTKFECCPYSMA